MANFSRDTYNEAKNYVGVRLQQGVPLVDADWNEMDEIRKHELENFIRGYVGDGVPGGNDGFKIKPVDGVDNDFIIHGGEGLPGGIGRCVADGIEARIADSVQYTAQPLYQNQTLADQWQVAVLPPLAPPAEGTRSDLVYLDIWERIVDGQEDNNLVNPAIAIETCVRLKREWVVRVAEDAVELPEATEGHVFYPLAELNREAGVTALDTDHIIDKRGSGISIPQLVNSFNDLVELAVGGSSKAGDLAVPGKLGVGTHEPGWELEVDGAVCAETVMARTIRASKLLINGRELSGSASAQAEIDQFKAAIADLTQRIQALEEK